MPVYEIEQYELHAQKFRVEADSEAAAIDKLSDGEGVAVHNSQEYIEVADDFALPVDEYADLTDALRKLGVVVGIEVIPSIRGSEQVQ